MKTPEIKNIKGENTIKELLHALELLQEVRVITDNNIPTREIAERECLDFYDKMWVLGDSLGDLICNISDAIGALLSVQISDIYLEPKHK